jgi:lipopolysaccharide biosynthesis protein
MGKGLQKLSRAWCGKLPVIIPEGKIRPVVPLVAVKFATKCNIVVRNHVHVLNQWKDYKDQFGNFEDFVGKLGVSTYISHLV